MCEQKACAFERIVVLLCQFLNVLKAGVGVGWDHDDSVVPRLEHDDYGNVPMEFLLRFCGEVDGGIKSPGNHF